MSLNDISLPPTVVADLYSNSLVDTGEKSTQKTVSTIPTTPTIPAVPQVKLPETKSTEGLKWLGDNHKKVLIIVNLPNAVHLPDDELQFLSTMLGACKMSIADVAIVNLNKQTQTYKEILKELNSRTALLFDVEPAGFGLPMNFPHFQIQPYTGCSFLYAPALKELESDKVLKSKLWVSLRRLFNI